MYLGHVAFGDRAYGYHILGVLLHVLVSLGTFAVVSRLSQDVRAGLLGSLLFAGSAGHMEAVVWTSAMAYPVAALFGIGAIAFASRYVSTKNAWHLTMCAVLCMSALLMHETAILVPLGLVCYSLLVAPDKAKARSPALTWVAVAVTALWLVAYIGFYHAQGEGVLRTGEPSLLSGKHFVSNFLGALPTAVMPDPRSPGIQHRLPELLPLAVLPVNCLWVALSVLLPIAAFCGLWSKSPLIRFGVLWYLAGVCLGSLSGVGFAGRYLYMPMIGFALAAGCYWSNFLTSGRSASLRLYVTLLGAAVVSLNAAANVVALSYLARNGLDRTRLVTQLRQLSEGRARGDKIVVSNLPEKYRDVLHAGQYYGINVEVQGGGKYLPGTMYLLYSDGGLRVAEPTERTSGGPLDINR
jgi:hypothetical protein